MLLRCCWSRNVVGEEEEEEKEEKEDAEEEECWPLL